MRHEFSARTIKAAKERAGGRCEASGPIYGLEPETRCTTVLVAGNHDVDHYPLPAHAEGSDRLENAVVVCKVHHLFKTRTFDTPAEAKIKRVRRKHGIDPDLRKPRRKLQSAPFQKSDRKILGRWFHVKQ